MDVALYEAPDGILVVRVAGRAEPTAAGLGLRPVGHAAVVTGNLSAELVAALRHCGGGPAQPGDVRRLLAARNRGGAPC